MSARLTFFLRHPFGLLVLMLAAMWVIEAVDTYVLSSWAQSGGIHPRKLDGLDGILAAPFLHSDWSHIASNSVPWLALGGLVSVRGWRHWATVSGIILVVGGAATWALADGVNHVGASGIIFGYFGAVLASAFFERRPATVGPALIVIMMYAGMLVGIVPQEGISWEGHLFGMLAGILAAWLVADRSPAPAPEPYVPMDWEADEPWLGTPEVDTNE